MVYFVLYVVLITELLVVITERDELDAKDYEIRDKMLNTLAESYNQPLILSVPQHKSEYNVGSKDGMRVTLITSGLVTEEERKQQDFFVDISPSSKSIPSDWPRGGISSKNAGRKYRIYRDNGGAVFSAEFSSPGEYTFAAYSMVERRFPLYLPEFLLNTLKEKVGENRIAKSKKTEFIITAKGAGSVKKKDSEMFF